MRIPKPNCVCAFMFPAMTLQAPASACGADVAETCVEAGVTRQFLRGPGSFDYRYVGAPTPRLRGYAAEFSAGSDDGDFFLLRAESLSGAKNAGLYHSSAERGLIVASYYWRLGGENIAWYAGLGLGNFDYANEIRYSGSTSSFAEGHDSFLSYGGGFRWMPTPGWAFSASVEFADLIILEPLVGTRTRYTLEYEPVTSSYVSLALLKDDWSEGLNISYAHRF